MSILRRIAGMGPAGLLSLAILLLVLFLAVFGQWLTPHDPMRIFGMATPEAPSWEFLMGTDYIGRDILSRLIAATQVTLRVVALSVGLSLVVGVLLGLVSGYIGGFLDVVIMRFTDALLAFPMLILALAIVSILGPGENSAIIAIAVANVPNFCRLVRGEVLKVKSREFVQAARSIGLSGPRVAFVHVLPSIMGSIVVFTSLSAANALITESALSFLGLGVQPPMPSWGGMVAAGMGYLTQWWVALFPGVTIFVVVLALSVIGDHLRDLMDPRLS